MQYQVFKEQTGEMIAWLDTEDDKYVVLGGYDVKVGKDLHVREVEDEKPSVRVAKFEKVSFTRYHADVCISKGYMSKVPDLVNKGTDIYLNEMEMPRRSTKGSAGYDIFAPFDFTIKGGETLVIPTGLKCELAEEYYLMAVPRSGLGFKYGLAFANTVGIIDSDYYNNEKNEGHILVKVTNHSDRDLHLLKGQAYCQMLIHRYYVTDDDCKYEKPTRKGGYGSTDK